MTIPASAAERCPALSEADQRAKALYEAGVVQEARGDLAEARESYERLEHEYPDTPFACWARTRLENLQAGKSGINKQGRAQFIVGSTLAGAWAGWSLANIALQGDDDLSETDSKIAIWSSIGGAAAALVPSILLTPDLPMSTGRATMINFGWTWGAYHGFMLSLLAGPDITVQGVYGLSLGTSALGWGSAFTLTHFYDVADGDAAAMAAAAGWATWVTAALAVIVDQDFFEDENVFVPVLLAGGDAGLASAAIYSRWLDMSAGRVGLINLGGFLGGLVGGGILALAEPDAPRPAAATLLATSLLGLGAATYFTQDYDLPETIPATTALLEFNPQGLRFGIPVPLLKPGRVRGQLVTQVEIPLVGGTL